MRPGASYAGLSCHGAAGTIGGTTARRQFGRRSYDRGRSYRLRNRYGIASERESVKSMQGKPHVIVASQEPSEGEVVV